VHDDPWGAASRGTVGREEVDEFGRRIMDGKLFNDLSSERQSAWDQINSCPPEAIQAVLKVLRDFQATNGSPAPEHERISQAIADFRMIISWIRNGHFDHEACLALCFLAIERLEGKAKSEGGT